MCCSLDISIAIATKMNAITEYNRNRAPVSPSPVPENNRHVRFLDYVVVSPTPSPLELLDSEEEWSAAWYRMEDLEVFRTEARDLCRQMRVLHTTTEATMINPEVPKTPLLARDNLTRGLEQRSCAERQRRKYLTTRFILKAAPKLRHDPNKLAALAQRCTEWASELAVEEGARDSIRVRTDSDCDTAHTKSKRSSPHFAINSATRRVRSRLTLIQD